ncbi:cupin domain-containing protein [Paucihalobacter ruber]|uniref:Cupin domain-containing protein n=1 Tax=Paucihalobacter ruber TaxID=2567861 RepID=A0A506PK83_9FLAO|nr:cupin domain-containing protein [Paucihalobacter ruber]
MRILIFCCFAVILLTCNQKPNLPDPLEAGWKGEKVCEVVHEDDDIRVLKCTFPPNVGHEWHRHQPHFGFALSGGTFKIKDDKGTRTVEVKTGTAFSNQEVTQHEVLNIGDSTAIFLITEHK